MRAQDHESFAKHASPIRVAELAAEAPRPKRTEPAVHEHVALAFFVSGTAVLEQRGQFELEGGDAMLVPAGEPHRVVYGGHANVWGIAFCPSCVAPSGLAHLLDPFERARAGASPVVRIAEARRGRMVRLIRDLEAALGLDDAHADLERRSLLALILTEVARAAPAHDSAAMPTPVSDALRFIERQCLTPISLADVARAVGRSPAHLTTAVKHATGKSVGAWIIAGRLAEARRRLAHTDDSIENIADHVGYADATHFIRLFKREHGETPASWRASRRR